MSEIEDYWQEEADTTIEQFEEFLNENDRENKEFGNALAEHRCLGEGVTDDDIANAPEWDRPLLEMYQGVTNPESDPSRYEERGEADAKFYWSGATPGDDRQTEACEWLIEQTNPNYGGDPVLMDELRDMVAEAPEHDDDMPDNMARPDSWTVHINERSTFVKAPGT